MLAPRCERTQGIANEVGSGSWLSGCCAEFRIQNTAHSEELLRIGQSASKNGERCERSSNARDLVTRDWEPDPPVDAELLRVDWGDAASSSLSHMISTPLSEPEALIQTLVNCDLSNACLSCFSFSFSCRLHSCRALLLTRASARCFGVHANS